MAADTFDTGAGDSGEVAYDLFVSYARSDDQRNGWVTRFVDELKTVLLRKRGEDALVFFGKLSVNEPVTQELLRAVARSRVLLLFMSPGFCKSDWCQRELASFAANAAALGLERNIFAVEIETVALEQRPPPLRSLEPISFLEQPPGANVKNLAGYPKPDLEGDRFYWSRLNELAHQIAERLRDTRSGPPRHAVVLADAADDIDDRHAELASALKQRPDVVLLPARPHSRALSTDFEASVRSDLAMARLHLQLLSLSSGQSLPGGGRRIVTMQALLAQQQAQNGGPRLMRWLPRELDPAHASDEVLASILQDPTISRLPFEAFRMEVMRAIDEFGAGPLKVPQPAPLAAPRPATVPSTERATSPVPKPSPAAADAEGLAIYLQAAPEDAANAQRIAEYLFESGATVQMSPDPTPGQGFIDCLRAQEETLSLCDGVLLVYGHSPVNAVSTAFQYAQRVFGVRRPGVWSAVLDLPPGDKPALKMLSRNLMHIDCRIGFEPARLAPFYRALREAPAARHA